MNLTTATPAEIDTELADLYEQLAKLEYREESARKTYARNLRPSLNDTYREALDAATAEVQEFIEKHIAPLNVEYARRGGWTRAFLVANSNGHVHSSRSCSTTFVSTQWAWLPQLSGKDEAEIVEAAGSDACTVCYPSAPVEVLSRPRSVFSKDEVEAQKERAERDAQKAERQRQKIAKAITADGSELLVTYFKYGSFGRESFKTERAAVSWAVEEMANGELYGYEVAMDGVYEVARAFALKHGMSSQDVLEQVLQPKVAAKVKRDSR